MDIKTLEAMKDIFNEIFDNLKKERLSTRLDRRYVMHAIDKTIERANDGYEVDRDKIKNK